MDTGMSRAKAALKAWVGGILTAVQHCNEGYNFHDSVLPVYHSSAPCDGIGWLH